MSDSIFQQYAEGMATLNTALQDVFGRDNARLVLLKRSTQNKTFTELTELTEGWRVEYGEIRDDIFLFYSTSDDIADMWAEMTHIGFGVPDANNQIFVYEIQPDQKEKTTPDIFNHEWKAFAVRVKKERY